VLLEKFADEGDNPVNNSYIMSRETIGCSQVYYPWQPEVYWKSFFFLSPLR